jgi:hypothetical protein
MNANDAKMTTATMVCTCRHYLSVEELKKHDE